MRKRFNATLALAALLFAAATPARAQQQPAWQKFEPEGESFSVLLPTKPAAETQVNPEDRRMVMRMYTSESGGLLFHVSSMDVSKLFAPTAANFNAFAAGMLNTFCGPARAAGLECALPFERELRLNGSPGKQYKISITGRGQTAAGVLRVYMVGGHIYTLQVMGAGEGDAAADRFLNSFAPAAAKPAAK